MSGRTWISVAAPVAVGLIFLLAWHAIVAINQVPTYIVPGPLLCSRRLRTIGHRSITRC